MANELKHGSVGTELTQAEWEGIGTHVIANQAVGDIIYASTTAQLRRLGVGSNTNVLTLASGIPSWAAPAAAAAGSLTGSTLASGVTASSLTSVGTLTALTVDNVAINGTTIGHTGDTDLITVASGTMTLAGTIDMGNNAINNVGASGNDWSATAFSHDGGATFNSSGGDYDFTVAGDTDGNMIDVDAGLDTIAFGTSASNGQFLAIQGKAITAAADASWNRVAIQTGNGITIPSGTASHVGSMNIDEPTITATGTVTNAYTLRIQRAPTEGSNNYAFWVDAGVSRFDGNVDLNSSGTILNIGAAGNDFGASTLDLAAGYTISGAGELTVEAASGNLNLGNTGNIKFLRSSSTMALIGASGIRLAADTAHGTTAGTNVLSIFNGTAPVGTLANGASFFCAAGEMKVIDAAGNVTVLSPHDDDGQWISDSRDSVTGRGLRIQMERLMRRLDEEYGGGFIEEFTEEIGA